MPFNIRLARDSDVGAIAALVKQYWEFERIDGFDHSRVARLLTDLVRQPERGYCWVADGEGKIKGYLLAVTMFSLEHGGAMAEIDELFVGPGERSVGIGSALLRQAEHDLTAAGLVRLQLQLGVTNPRAKLFYARHGFQARGGYRLMDKSLRGSRS